MEREGKSWWKVIKYIKGKGRKQKSEKRMKDNIVCLVGAGGGEKKSKKSFKETEAQNILGGGNEENGYESAKGTGQRVKRGRSLS